jgi:hypothetical protein
MNSKEFFSVGARLLGIYFIVIGTATLPPIVESWAHGPVEVDAHAILYTFIAVVHASILIAGGLALLLRYRLTTFESARSPVTEGQFLIVGVQLLGMYFTASGASYVLAQLIAMLLPVAEPSGHMTLRLFEPFTRPAMQAIAGVLLMWKAPQIVALLPRAAPIEQRQQPTE